jgi:hypothetical protein
MVDIDEPMVIVMLYFILQINYFITSELFPYTYLLFFLIHEAYLNMQIDF